MQPGKQFRVLVLILSASILGPGCVAGSASARESPRAVEGLLDLTGWEFENDGIAALDGEWEFFWRQLLEPADFDREPSPPKTGFLTLPSPWSRHELEGKELPGQGYATFRLTVRIEPSSSLRSLYVGEVMSAYRLWVNGVMWASRGIVGEKRDEEKPAGSAETFSFPVGTDTIELLIQVSNFHHARGGIWGDFKLGTDAQIRAMRSGSRELELFLFGSLFIIGIYHFGFYALRRREKAPLYFAVFSLAIASRAITQGDKGFLSQYISWELTYKIDYLTICAAVPFAMMFFRSLYPEEVSRIFVRASQVVWGVLALLVLVTPVRVYSHTTEIFQPVLGLTLAYWAYALVLAVARRKEGSLLFLAGVVAFSLAVVNDILNNARIITNGYWSPQGFVIFILTQAYLLSARFAHSLALSEDLSANLEKKVRERTNELSLAKEQLQLGNELIRRYLPSHLAENILSGDYEELDRPERRKLTIFFSDVEGFTLAADQLEPEELSALLNEYLAEMSDIADAHGATINQFVGDGLMILFGAHETTTGREQALRAVRMSLAMQARMATLQSKWFEEGIQTPFRIRVGINTGTASVGNYGSAGRMTYSAIGNQTNLAARIQSDCEPGKVLISHSTWALVKDEIACVDKGEIEVKGLHYPVRVYEVTEEGSPDTANP